MHGLLLVRVACCLRCTTAAATCEAAIGMYKRAALQSHVVASASAFASDEQLMNDPDDYVFVGCKNNTGGVLGKRINAMQRADVEVRLAVKSAGNQNSMAYCRNIAALRYVRNAASQNLLIFYFLFFLIFFQVGRV